MNIEGPNSSLGAKAPKRHQRVVITGAAGEIGLAIANRYAARGADLVLTDLDLQQLETAVQTLPGPAKIHTLAHDVTSVDAAIAVQEACKRHIGAVDVLVCCAGLYEAFPIDKVGPSEWRKSLAVNLDGVFHTVQALRPLLADNSSIVNIASLAGHRGSPSHTPYAAAKGGVLTLSRSLAQELAPRTRVNAISPGLIDTKMMGSLDEDRKQSMIAATPLHRLGSADEVAGVAVFLSSPEAAFITGETIQVNGGFYLHS